MNDQQRKPRTFVDYLKMKKLNPAQYHSAKTQLEIISDRQALGEAFYQKDDK